MDLNILDLIVTKPIYIQMAKNGQWDTAWKILLPNDKPSKSDIKNFLDDSPERLAFELFYETVDGRKFLFGSYFSDSFVIKDMTEFLCGIFSIVFNKNLKKISNIIRDTSKLCTDSNDMYFQGQPNELVLGVLDSWRFYKPCTLWKNECLSKSISSIDEKQLAKFPHLMKNSDNSSLLEFVWSDKYLHFIGFTVSDLDIKRKVYTINFRHTNKLIKALL